MYGGISNDSSPNGPLMYAVLADMALAPFTAPLGAMMLSSTPGGTESGSDPILELHRADDVKDLGAANRGRRKVGIESAAGEDELASASAHRRRAGANMMWMWTAGCWRSFWVCRCEVAFSPMMRGPSAEMVHSSRLIRDFRSPSIINAPLQHGDEKHCFQYRSSQWC
jgi:hypothetical protein